MKNYVTQSFRGYRALLLYVKDRDSETIEAQLSRLGIDVEYRDLADSLPWTSAHICIFDADAQRRPRFLSTVERPVIPTIAVVGAETSERIQWSLVRGVSSFLVKPVREAGIYLALMQANFMFRQGMDAIVELESMRERVKSRRVVFNVLLKLMQRHGLDENEAYDRIRKVSQKNNVSVEELCVAIASDIHNIFDT